LQHDRQDGHALRTNEIQIVSWEQAGPLRSRYCPPRTAWRRDYAPRLPQTLGAGRVRRRQQQKRRHEKPRWRHIQAGRLAMTLTHRGHTFRPFDEFIGSTDRTVRATGRACCDDARVMTCIVEMEQCSPSSCCLSSCARSQRARSRSVSLARKNYSSQPESCLERVSQLAGDCGKGAGLSRVFRTSPRVPQPCWSGVV
jgi:hypothetical protein